MSNRVTRKNIDRFQILLSSSDSNEVYLGGETLSGKVMLKDDKPITKKNLSLSFIGELSEYNSSASTMTAASILFNKHTVFHTTDINLSSSGTANSRSKDATEDGFRFPFEFKIPANLPPSTDGAAKFGPYGSIACVHYYLLLARTQSEKKDKEIARLPIYVFPSVSPMTNLADIDCNEHNRKDLSVHLTMSQGFLMCDAKQLNFGITIDNPNNCTIDNIEAQFIQKCRLRGSDYRKKLGDLKVRATSNWARRNSDANLSIPLQGKPRTMPPTVSSMMHVVGNNDIIVSYVLKVKVRVSGFRNDIRLKIPVFVCNTIS